MTRYLGLVFFFILSVPGTDGFESTQPAEVPPDGLDIQMGGLESLILAMLHHWSLQGRGGQDQFFENEAIRGEFSARNGKRYGIRGEFSARNGKRYEFEASFQREKGNDTIQDASFFNKKQEKQGKNWKNRGKNTKKQEKTGKKLEKRWKKH